MASSLPLPTQFRPESLLGATLDGRYLLVAHLASGGMGAIFRAEHVHLRKDVAIKVLRPDLTSSPDLVERFRREAEIAATLAHENIVRVTDFGRSPEGWLFLTMELLEGESLFDRLRRTGAMPPEQAVPILAQICRGLDAAHRRGVIHRDLKPENIFLVGGEAPCAKILDFGIAKITDPGTPSETQAGMVVGTPEYLSPEQAMGTAVDGRADIYGVGLIAWRMLVGRHPFSAPDARGLVLMQATRTVPPISDARPALASYPALVAAVQRACAKDPALRHAEAGLLAAELEAGLSPDAQAPPGIPEQPPAPTLPSVSGPAPAPSGPPRQTLALETVPAGAGATPPLARNGSRRGLWLALALAAATAAVLGSGLLAGGWLRARPAEAARELLGDGKAEEARQVLARALPRQPRSAELHLLLGRALSHLPGQASAAVEAYANAAAIDPHCLDEGAFADLAGALAQDRKVAERAAALLARAGSPAGHAVLAAASAGPGPVRLRALDLARTMGIEARLDRVAIYGALLADPECEVRRAAARRLGEINNPAALPKLGDLARARRDTRTALGFTRRVPVCGADEAAEAISRIEESVARGARKGH